MLLYPSPPDMESEILRSFGIDGFREMMSIARLDVACDRESAQQRLLDLFCKILGIVAAKPVEN